MTIHQNATYPPCDISSRRPANSCCVFGCVANENAAESGTAMSANVKRPARAPQSPDLPSVTFIVSSWTCPLDG